MTLERALLTGVTGFVGAHLARTLVAGGLEVHAVVRPGAHLGRIPDLTGTVVLHEDDGGSGLPAVVAAARPQVTFHLATRFVADHRPDEAGPMVLDNVAFPTRLADAVAGSGSVFVNAGTAWQHVGGAPYRPRNLYAATKQAFEDVLEHYRTNAGMATVTVNLFDSYGPRDHRGKLLATLIRALRCGTPLEMSSGDQLIDLVHVDDIVQALILAADVATGEAGSGPYAVSSGRPHTVREIVDLLGRVAGRPVPVRWGARPDRPGEMLEPWDAGPAVPGWAPTVDLETGVGALLRG